MALLVTPAAKAANTNDAEEAEEEEGEEWMIPVDELKAGWSNPLKAPCPEALIEASMEEASGPSSSLLDEALDETCLMDTLEDRGASWTAFWMISPATWAARASREDMVWWVEEEDEILSMEMDECLSKVIAWFLSKEEDEWFKEWWDEGVDLWVVMVGMEERREGEPLDQVQAGGVEEDSEDEG